MNSSGSSTTNNNDTIMIIIITTSTITQGPAAAGEGPAPCRFALEVRPSVLGAAVGDGLFALEVMNFDKSDDGNCSNKNNSDDADHNNHDNT